MKIFLLSFRILFLASAFLWPCETTQAQDEIHQSYPVTPNSTLSINNANGPIQITGWNENRVQIDAIKRGNHEEFNALEIKIAARANRIEIMTVNAAGSGRTRNSAWVAYEIKLPQDIVLFPVATISGNITIQAAGTRIKAHTTSGKIVVRAASGDLQATAVNGEIRAENIGGELQADATNGSIYFLNIGKRVNAHTVSGAIFGNTVGGDATLQTVNGSIEAQNITGRVGASTVSGDITLTNVENGVRADAVSGEITLANIGGLIEAKNTSGDITVTNSKSPEVLLNSHSGDISFGSALLEKGHYTFETFSGDLTIAIPADTNFQVLAKTFSGTIETTFPLVTTNETGTKRSARLAGTHGTGDGAQITITGFNASIKLIKTPAR